MSVHYKILSNFLHVGNFFIIKFWEDKGSHLLEETGITNWFKKARRMKRGIYMIWYIITTIFHIL